MGSSPERMRSRTCRNSGARTSGVFGRFMCFHRYLLTPAFLFRPRAKPAAKGRVSEASLPRGRLVDSMVEGMVERLDGSLPGSMPDRGAGSLPGSPAAGLAQGLPGSGADCLPGGGDGGLPCCCPESLPDRVRRRLPGSLVGGWVDSLPESLPGSLVDSGPDCLVRSREKGGAGFARQGRGQKSEGRMAEGIRDCTRVGSRPTRTGAVPGFGVRSGSAGLDCRRGFRMRVLCGATDPGSGLAGQPDSGR